MKIAPTLAAVTAIAFLTVAGCVADDGTLAQDEEGLTSVDTGFLTNVQVHTPGVVTFGSPYCAAGSTLSTFTTEACVEPVKYACTEYLCTDAYGRQSRAKMYSGANPSCEQEATEEGCSNDVVFDERSLPTPKQLNQLLPRVYDSTYAKAPLLKTKTALYAF